MRLFCLLIGLLLFGGTAIAEPVLPTEFYGNVTVANAKGAPGIFIRAYDSSNNLCGQYRITTEGYFGLLSCNGDDPYTSEDEGASEGETVRFTYNGLPASAYGDPSWSSSQFHIVQIVYPELVCGDTFCDGTFESCNSCPSDCGACPPPGGGGGDGGGGSGGGGGGGGIGGGGTSGGAQCKELWKCGSWGPCMPDRVQTRFCEDINGCGTVLDVPILQRACDYVPGCFDSIQNGQEEGIDCGGPCKPCTGCADGIQNNGELGIDCGGPCDPCPTCYDRIRNQGEEGVDCGGTCTPCKERLLEFPARICERIINPLNPFFLMFLFIVFAGTVFKVTHSQYRMAKLKKDGKLSDLDRARKYLSERRKMWLFVISISVVTVILILYYYLFGICADYSRYLWLLVLFLLGSPLIVHAIMRQFEWDEKKQLDALKRATDTHLAQVDALLRLQNDNIVQLERELELLIKGVLSDPDVRNARDTYPRLDGIARRFLALYDAYRENPHPYKLERALCEDIYSLEHDAAFQELVSRVPSVKVVYEKLQFLYQQYEEKERIYSQ